MSSDSRSWVVTDYGAVADGTTNNSWAIQRTIDACSIAGGGRVVIPSGTFMSGKIFLRSKIEFHLETDARLLCSPYFEDVKCETQTKNLRSGFLCAENAEDISITGSGVLDGNGQAYVMTKQPGIYVMQRGRPRTLVFLGCSRVKVTGITVRDGAEWTLWFCGCVDLTIERISLYNDLKIPNSDGIDLDHCCNVRISHCHIEAGDDAIVLKTTRGAEHYGGCENVTVQNCTLKSTSAALIIGCEIASPVRHVVFDSCIITGSHRGLAINHSFESDIEDIVFSNITLETRLFDDRWWGGAEAIYVKALPWTEHDKVGHIRNVRFQNIKARSENGILVWGESPDRIGDIRFENIALTLAKWTKYPLGQLDLRPCPGANNGYASGVIAHPTAAILLHNAQRVMLHNVDVTFDASYPEPARVDLTVENVEELVKSDFRSHSNQKEG